MNLLVLTRGVPGSGKSSWVRESGLGAYSICPDDIRLMYCAPEMKTDGSFCISQKADKYVWEFVFKALEQRMKLGCFTIIDATHTKESAINAYKKLCEKYNYTCLVVDFSNVPLETCLERNAGRYPKYKVVPDDVIKRMHENLTKSKIPSWCKLFKGQRPDIRITKHIKDTEKYNSIFVFGDIHGCYSPLENFFKDNPYSKDNLYIFVGDYLDRGIQNKEVLEFLIKHTDDENFVFLRGNHESWLDFYSKGLYNDIKSEQFMKHTINEINGIDVEGIKHFIDKLEVCVSIDDHYGNRYFITHGGIPEIPWYVYPKQCINGVGGYEDSEIVDEQWSKLHSTCAGGNYSIHGHRNLHHVSMHNTHSTYNLCDSVEKGGYLRVLQIIGEHRKELMYKNDVYDKKYDMEETK